MSTNNMAGDPRANIQAALNHCRAASKRLEGLRARPRTSVADGRTTVRVTLHIPAEEYAAWKAIADAEGPLHANFPHVPGQGMSALIRYCVNRTLVRVAVGGPP